ncbi:MAG: hypothetical protein BGO78_17780 [Chloroflexi bacterium 44-23]|nr:MAG: hypothetical protein BGO78_17780 [Chloroflexi bacterium 44-23]
MKSKFYALLLIAVLVLTACGAKSQSRDFPNLTPSGTMESPSFENDFASGEKSYDGMSPNVSGESGLPPANVVRLVIRNAELSIVVDDPAKVMSTINQMAERMGGYVVSSNLWKSVNYSGIEVPEASISIRVPANLLNQAIDEIKNLTNDRQKDVLSENVSGQDVTKEYTDLNSRLANLEEAEAQLRSIMEEAKKTEDVLNVFNQLTYYREQIEVIKGQIKYYEESAALSAINVSIKAHEAVNPISVAGWKPSVTVSKALQALVNSMQVIVDAVIWIVISVIPVLIIIFLPLYLIFLAIRAAVRRSNKKRLAKKQADTVQPTNPKE